MNTGIEKQEMLSIQAVIEVSPSDVADMMCSAIEQNHMTRSWCSDILPQFSTVGLQSPWYSDPSIYKEGLKIRCKYDVQGEVEGLQNGDKILTWEDFTKGVQLMATNSPSHFGDWVTENYDACTADVFWQYVVLGEVPYG